MDLKSWIADNCDQIKPISDIRNIDIHMINKALEIVKEFIISRKLILYGGQAIDYALRLKGSKSYPDTQIPDLDFLSTRSVDDAYDLADILIKKGFKNVNAVRAIHAQTMKVRIDFIWVADISYVPDKVFKRLPTLKYNGMNILHPDYQRSDMHLAFCFPYANAPREDIFNRFKKDLKRFNMFQEYYPIEVRDSKIIECTESKTFKLDKELMKGNNALHGFAAYNIFVSEYNKIMNLPTTDTSNKKPDETLINDTILTNKSEDHESKDTNDICSITVKFPKLVDQKLQIASSDVKNVIQHIGNENLVKSYISYMEFRPILHVCDNYIIYSVENQLLSITILPNGYKIVNIQYLLMDFLYHYFTSENEIKELYYNLYANTLKMIIDITAKFGDKLSEDSSVFKLLNTTMGCKNYNQAYYIAINNLMKYTKDICINRSDEISDILEHHHINVATLPKGYYPASFANYKVKHPHFDYYANEEFQRDGHQIEKNENIIIEKDISRMSATGTLESIMDYEGMIKKTYCIEFKQLNRSYLDKILIAAGWESVTLNDILESDKKQVGIIATENKASWDKKLYDIHSNIKSRLDASNITQKVELHKSLMEAGVDFIPKTYLYTTPRDKSPKDVVHDIYVTDLSTNKKIEFNFTTGKYIWRPEGGFGGRGIAVFNNIDELHKIIKLHTKLFPKERALISEYIQDTMLIKLSINKDELNYKFHIRMYLIIAIVPDAPGLKAGRRTALCKYGEIANADKPFNLKTNDLSVHNTHIRSTTGVRFPDNYPGGIEKGIEILNKSAKILAYGSKLLLPTVKSFKESNGGYEILGVDMMVKKLSDGNEKPMLIEINTKTGYGLLKGDTPERIDWLSEFILGGVAELLLDNIKFKDSNIIKLYEL